jgi:threonine dehydratase/serine racemase
MTNYATNFNSIREAARRIASQVHRTPIATCRALDALADRQLFFKCEHLQKVGAFKFRGACNAVNQLTDEQASRGVVTHSSGNHAQALALAAKQRGIAAHIVMPRGATPAKRQAVLDYGGRVIDCEPTLPARESTAARVQEETGAVLIPPYDHADIIAGQGTAALELLEQVADLDAVIAPIGGGGLMAGTSLVARQLAPRLRIFAAEPAGANSAALSLAAGERVIRNDPATLADGLRTSVGTLTWPIIRDHVEQIFTLDEASIIAAMRLAWERGKLLIEPSAAVALAAVLSDEFRAVTGVNRIGVILSGGNTDLDHMPWLTS